MEYKHYESPFCVEVPPFKYTSDGSDPFKRVGRKDDAGKLDLSLFMEDLPHAIAAVTQVLQWAITDKLPTPYQRGSWQSVPEAGRRYAAAGMRHELSFARQRQAGVSDPVDPETGLTELAHIATNALLRLELALRKTK